MFPRPTAIGLTLCDYVLVEEGTRKVSLIGTFARLVADQFPFVPPRFFAYAVLTDGAGDATMTLRVTNPDLDDLVYERRRRIRLPHRLGGLHVGVRVEDCSFPVPGKYDLVLSLDGEAVTHCHLDIVAPEEPS